MLSIREFRKIQEPGTRRCSKCGKIKPIEEFVKNGNRTPDGRMSKCKNCHRLQTNKRREIPEVRQYYQELSKKRREKIYKTRVNRSTKRNTPGYIYIFKWDKFCKIGCAKNPEQRISAIDGSLPFRGNLICKIPTNSMRDAELYLHDTYLSNRRGGEWFELSDNDINSLCNIAFIDYSNNQIKLLK